MKIGQAMRAGGLKVSRHNSETKGKRYDRLQATKPRPASRVKAATGRLFVLEINADRIHVMNPDGSDKKTIVTNCHLPDGIVVDAEARHIYWTNMGIPNLDDGSIERADLDGGNRRVISRRASPTRRNRSTSIRKAASSIGATARACA